MFSPEGFNRDGFAVVPSMLFPSEVDELIQLLEKAGQPASARGGMRNVVDAIPELGAVAGLPEVRSLVELVLGPDAFVVRATLFDKTPEANWKVPWHQDVTIAVHERQDTPRYGPWSIKAGVPHVQPPAEVLERMVTVRVHLDDCPQDNGALRVMPGSHRLGKLDQNRVEPWIDERRAICCAVDRGGALVMRPLLLHASSASTQPRHRRVLHFDFAVGDLDDGLEWRMREAGYATHRA